MESPGTLTQGTLTRRTHNMPEFDAPAVESQLADIVE